MKLFITALFCMTLFVTNASYLDDCSFTGIETTVYTCGMLNGEYGCDVVEYNNGIDCVIIITDTGTWFSEGC